MADQSVLFYVTIALLVIGAVCVLFGAPAVGIVFAIAGVAVSIAMMADDPKRKVVVQQVAEPQAIPAPPPENGAPEGAARAVRQRGEDRRARKQRGRHERGGARSGEGGDVKQRRKARPSHTPTIMYDRPPNYFEGGGGSGPDAPEGVMLGAAPLPGPGVAADSWTKNLRTYDSPVVSCEASGDKCTQAVLARQRALRAAGDPVANGVLEAAVALSDRRVEPGFVTKFPECCPSTPAGMIRQNGLYGVKGNWGCDIANRSTVQDAGFVEPLEARNEMARYQIYDMPNKKNQYMVRVPPVRPEVDAIPLVNTLVT